MANTALLMKQKHGLKCNCHVLRKLNENPSPRTVPGLPEKVYSMKAKKCLHSVKNEVAMKVFEYYNKLNLI